MRFAQSARPRFAGLRLERLEDRTVPSSYSWTGGPTRQGTNWFDAGNWNLNSNNNIHAVPGADDDAVIGAPNVGDPSTITFNGIGAVHSLSVLRNFNMTGGTLSLGSGTSNFGTYLLNGGTLDIQNGAFLQNIVINGPGTLNLPAGRTISLFASTINAAMTNFGTMISPYVNSISGFTVGAAFINEPGATIWVQGGGANFNAAFTNHGTVQLQSTAVLDPTTTLLLACNANSTNAPDGTIVANLGTGSRRKLTIGNQSTFDNQGTIQTTGIDLTIDSATSDSTFQTEGTLAIGAGTTLVDGRFITINYNGGSVTGGTWDWTQSHTTVNLNASFANTGVDLKMDSGTTINGPGTLTNVAGRTITTDSPIFNAAVVNQNGATMVFNNRATINNTFTNHGAIQFTSVVSHDSGLNVNAPFTNATDGSITDFTGAGGARIISLGSGTTFDNQGLLHVSGVNLTVTSANSPTPTFKTSGTLSIDPGTTLTTGSFTNVNYSGGSVTGGGTWAVAGGFTTLTLNANLTNASATIILTSATVNGPGTFTSAAGQTFSANSGGVTTFNAAVVNNGGFVIVAGTSATFNGGLTNSSGATFRIQATASAGPGVTVASNLINNGTLILDGNSTTNTVEFSVNAGTFTNGPGGSIVSSGGFGTHRLRFFGGSGFVNQGTLTLSGANFGLTNNGAASATITNSGTISLGAGTTLNTDYLLTNAIGGTLAGVGALTGNVANAGTVSPGTSPGSLTVNGNYSQTGSLAIELNGAAAGTEYDQVKVNGTVSLGGALTLSGTFTPPVGTQFTIIDNNGTDAVIGAFSNAPGGTIAANGTTFSVNYAGGTGNDVVLTVTAAAPPTVTAVGENAGAAQRSMVTSVQVTFSTAVAIGAGAFSLTYIGAPSGTTGGNVGSTVGGFTVSTATVGGVTVATLSAFTGTDTAFGSLIDGRYSLTVDHTKVSGNGLTMTSDFTFADSGSTTGNQLYRLYGDANGDRAVNGGDLTPFILSFGGPSATFDFNGDGVVNGADVTELVKRFGLGL